MQRIIIPTIDETGLKASIAPHFGRTPYFTMIEIADTNEIIKVSAIPNTGDHFGGRAHPHDLILEHHPDAIIVCGMGPRGLQTLQQAGIAVLKAQGQATKDIVSAYLANQLTELTTGCHQARHQ